MNHDDFWYLLLESNAVITLILRRKKDGDWYIYPQFLAHENFKNVHKKAQKGCIIFKPAIHNVLSTGTNIVKFGFPCVLYAVLGSQGIVVKCTAAIFLPGQILGGKAN